MYFVYFIPIGDLVNMGSLLRLVLLKSVFVTVFASINNVSTECSKFDFEEKILEKLIKLEYKMQTHEELINKWKIDLQTGLKNIEEVKQGEYLYHTKFFVGSCCLLFFLYLY